MAGLGRRWLLCSVLLLASNANAQSIVDKDVDEDVDEDIYERLQQQIEIIYADTIAEYDREVARHPGDVVIARRRCDALQSFAYSEEYYLEAAEGNSEHCFQALRENYPANIESELAILGRRYDEQVAQDADALFVFNGRSYNDSQRARLRILKSQRFPYDESDASRSAIACAEALALDVASHCRLQAAEFYIDNQRLDTAIQVLSSPLDPHTDVYYLVQKIVLLAKLEASDEVAAIYSRVPPEDINDYVGTELATSLAKAGLHGEALATLDAIGDDFWDSSSLSRARVDVAMIVGDYEAALLNYDEYRDLDYWNDPLLRLRLEIAAHKPLLGWRLADVLGLFGLLAVVALLIAISSLPAAGVHYRGLVRKTKGLAPGLLASKWSLRHATYAIFVLLLGSTVSLYVLEYDWVFLSWYADTWEEPLSPAENLSSVLVMNTMLFFAMLLPVTMRNGRWRSLGKGNWSILKCVAVGIGLALLMRMLSGVPVALFPDEFFGAEALTAQSAIKGMYLKYGLWPTLLITAILVPLIEETVFRGALLQGFSRHVSFPAANVLQSILFAAIHESLILFPFYAVLAYVAGVVARRAGGLLPVIVMHAVFNGIAVSLFAYFLSRI